MKNNWQTGIEFLGLLIVAGSLLFVAQQIKQDRKIALAQLNATQLEVFASRFNSGLESDAFLSMWAKRHLVASWDTDGLSNEEVAAAEISALVWWAYVEMAFENYREGLATEVAPLVLADACCRWINWREGLFNRRFIGLQLTIFRVVHFQTASSAANLAKAAQAAARKQIIFLCGGKMEKP